MSNSRLAFEQAIENEHPDDYSFDFDPNGHYRDEILERHFWAWQASRQVLKADEQVSVPEGYALVPKMMTLDFEAMGRLLCMTGEDFTRDEFPECVLWVGETLDDEGSVDAYGLNIACNECLEEGSIPVIEFANPVVTGAGDGASVPDNEYVRALQDACDIIQADANTEQNYGSLCRIGAALAKLKVMHE